MALGVGCACVTPPQDHSQAGAVTPEPTPEQTPEQASVATLEPTLAPTDAPTPVPEAVATPEGEWGSFTIESGNSLWMIAGQSDVLGDSMLWPILYKANRDEIADPDLIQPDQVLKYPTNPSDAQKAEAVREAEETPRYVPHTQPRRDLPIYQ